MSGQWAVVSNHGFVEGKALRRSEAFERSNGKPVHEGTSLALVP